MSLRSWISDSYKRVQHAGWTGVQDSIFWLYVSVLRKASKLVSTPGENVLDKEWDLLILLDSCRVDALQEVIDEYNYLNKNECDSIRSVSSTSEKWHTKTFTEEYDDIVSDIVLVTGNYKSAVLNRDNFRKVVEVWRDDWDLVPARPVTDAAIETGRQIDDRDRMIVHYMQPHLPSFPNPPSQPRIKYNGNREENWHRLRRGELTEAEVWDGYIENLRYVLDDVELLLNNIDAEKVVISADHGEAKGEYGVYSHPHGQELSCLRTVPWCVTTAVDNRSYQPGDYSKKDTLLEPDWPKK